MRLLLLLACFLSPLAFADAPGYTVTGIGVDQPSAIADGTAQMNKLCGKRKPLLTSGWDCERGASNIECRTAFHCRWSPDPAVNCVNPGGGCDGSVPCCGQSYCVRNRCQYVPEKI